jgi:hypothetical protein
MSSYNPAMQKAHLAAVQADTHGLISKKTAELDGVAVTEVTFARARDGLTISSPTPGPICVSCPTWPW